ncbi:MAG: sigma-54 dependent transcriptional regulator [bacterium]
MQRKILIVDDEPHVLEVLERFLTREGYAVEKAANGREALQTLSRRDFDVVVADVKMPEMNGMELLGEIRKLPVNTEVIMMTAYGSVEGAVEAMKAGAYNFVEKPVNVEKLLATVRNAAAKIELEEKVENLSRQLGAEFDAGGIIGKSLPMLKTLDMVRKISNSGVNVMIAGESGTGKELIARTIHRNSGRKDGPFVPVNCGAVTETLFESEFFGHEKGAFTGAVARKDGYLKKADGGTLFLDEVGDLPLPMQTKLLRVIQEKAFERVGSTETQEADIRYISATNRNVKKMLMDGGFREDLFYRLNVVTVEIAPLRRRREDIPLLAGHFIEKHSKASGRKVKGISGAVMKIFNSYPWPGNVRELENVIQRAIAVAEKDVISKDDISEEIIKIVEIGAFGDAPISAVCFREAKKQAIDRFERNFMIEALKRNNGVVKNASEEIGLIRTAMQRLLKKHGIRSSDFKSNNSVTK